MLMGAPRSWSIPTIARHVFRLLWMKRELRDVARQVSDLENTLREQEAKVARLSREIAEFVVRLDKLEAEKREADKEALTSGHTLKQLEQEIGRATSRITTYVGE